jgi:N-acetylmuramoyl-L-alanine amidase
MKSAAAFILGLLFIAALTAFGIPDDAAPDAREGDLTQSLFDAPEAVPAWRRPDGPVRVALQAGHWKAAEAPDEQARLRTNGTRGGGKAEWEVNLGIAQRTAQILEEAGYAVDVLPTTIPPAYWADVFVAIHADGHPNTSVSGYRAAAPRRDRTGRADELVELLTQTYGAATGLPHYPTITRRMRSYYAFNSRRYHHALHPMTVGVILETGFLTSPRDRRIIVDAQDRAARGIADAVIRFLEAEPITESGSVPDRGAAR